MDEKVFAPYLVELTFSEKVIHALERLRGGKRVLKTRLSPKEMNDVGLCYWNGHIVPWDYNEAVKWYRYAAQQGYEVAEYNLYICYSEGTGVEKDPQKALEWLKKAAKHGYPNAQDLLGERYYTGENVRRNRRIAQLWFDKAMQLAIEQERVDTLNSFGMKYVNGSYGFKRNIKKAIYYFEKAGELDFPLSMAFLLSIYENARNKGKVEYWMDKFRNCRTVPKHWLESIEKQYASFMEEISGKS